MAGGILNLWFLLVLGHFVADYPLQSDFIAKGKNRFRPVDPASIPPGQKPMLIWPWVLTAHAGTHAAGRLPFGHRVLTLRAKPCSTVLSLRVSPADAYGDWPHVPTEARYANSPPAETFERGGTGAAGGRGALNAQQSGDAYNSRPLNGGQ